METVIQRSVEQPDAVEEKGGHFLDNTTRPVEARGAAPCYGLLRTKRPFSTQFLGEAGIRSSALTANRLRAYCLTNFCTTPLS